MTISLGDTVSVGDIRTNTLRFEDGTSLTGVTSFVTAPNLDGGSSVLTYNSTTNVVSYKPPPAKIYASCTLTSDKSGSGSLIIGADGLTDQLSSSTPNVIEGLQGNVTYAGFKAPRLGIYNVSAATYVVATIGGVELHTKLRNAANTSSTTILKNAFYTNGTSAYSITNSTVLTMAQNEVVYFEVACGSSFTVRGDTNNTTETRLSFFNVD